MEKLNIGTAFSAVAVLLIVAIWTLCIWNERRHTKAPDAPPDYFQRDIFAGLGGLIVAVCFVLEV